MIEGLSKNIITASNGNGSIPCYIAAANDMDLVLIITKHKAQIDEDLLKYGGVLLRGFNIRALPEFNKIANAVSPNLLDYINRSTPRTKLGGKIYTATEYPSGRFIPFHNENSYTLTWPNKLLFLSLITADEGGETPIADSRHVYKHIDLDIIQEFNKRKIMYVRNYIAGIDLSWQEVFQTEHKAEVERYCQNNSISYEWKNNKVELTTRQICQASIKHPITNENVWFNQAHLFHISSLDKSDMAELVGLLGEGNLTRNAYYGDGGEIPETYLDQIRACYEKERIEFKWQKGDIMILDNKLMAHSRNPYKGNRKIAVAMGD